MYCKRLAENTGGKQSPKICHLGTIAQICRAVSSQLRHVSKIGKNLLNINISSRCPHNMANVGPLMAEIGLPVWGTPAKFQWVSRIGFVTAATSLTEGQPNFARCLAVSWAGTLCIDFGEFLPRSGNLPSAKLTLRPKLALFYFDSVTAQHSSSGRQPNFAALSRGRYLYSAGRPSRSALAHILLIDKMTASMIVKEFSCR